MVQNEEKKTYAKIRNEKKLAPMKIDREATNNRKSEVYLHTKKQRREGGFIPFFPSIFQSFVKKNPAQLGAKQRDDKKYCTYNTFFSPSSPLPLSHPLSRFSFLIAFSINIPSPLLVIAEPGGSIVRLLHVTSK